MEKNIEIMLSAFPKELEKDIRAIFKVITPKTELYNGGIFEVSVNNQMIYIPERIYYEDIEDNLVEELTEIQKQILNCFFTRHNNGYIRQQKLNNMINSGVIYKWAIPYIIRLLGEYIVEIIDNIHKNIDLISVLEMKEFIKDNEKFILTMEGRIASYWGEYYRFKFKKDDYVGFKVKKYIQYLRKTCK